MLISGRRQKSEHTDSKILREATLYLLLHYTKDSHIYIYEENFHTFFNYKSERTTARYVADLVKCSEPRHYWYRWSPISIELSWHKKMIHGDISDLRRDPSQLSDPHLVRLYRLCFIMQTLPDINPRLGTALAEKNYKLILADKEPFSTVAKLKEYCPFAIDDRTYQRDIKLINSALKLFAEYMTLNYGK